MELTDNDKQRIAMAGRNCEYPISFWEGAEYATIYERTQSSIEIANLKAQIEKLKSNDDRSKRGE